MDLTLKERFSRLLDSYSAGTLTAKKNQRKNHAWECVGDFVSPMTCGKKLMLFRSGIVGNLLDDVICPCGTGSDSSTCDARSDAGISYDLICDGVNATYNHLPYLELKVLVGGTKNKTEFSKIVKLFCYSNLFF